MAKYSFSQKRKFKNAYSRLENNELTMDEVNNINFYLDILEYYSNANEKHRYKVNSILQKIPVEFLKSKEVIDIFNNIKIGLFPDVLVMDRYYNNKEALEALLSYENLSRFISNEIKYVNLNEDCKVKDIFKLLLKYDGRQLEFLDEKLRDDKELVLIALKENPSAIRYAGPNCCNDPEIIMTIVNYALLHNTLYYSKFCYGFRFNLFELALLYGGKDIRNNRDIVKLCVEHDGMLLKYASEKLKNDPEIVKLAMKQNVNAFQYASEKLRTTDKKLIYDAVSQNGELIKFTGKNILNKTLRELAFKDIDSKHTRVGYYCGQRNYPIGKEEADKIKKEIYKIAAIYRMELTEEIKNNKEEQKEEVIKENELRKKYRDMNAEKENEEVEYNRENEYLYADNDDYE